MEFVSCEGPSVWVPVFGISGDELDLIVHHNSRSAITAKMIQGITLPGLSDLRVVLPLPFAMRK
jgi:hypothetical protein